MSFINLTVSLFTEYNKLSSVKIENKIIKLLKICIPQIMNSSIWIIQRAINSYTILFFTTTRTTIRCNHYNHYPPTSNHYNHNPHQQNHHTHNDYNYDQIFLPYSGVRYTKSISKYIY